MRDLIIVGGGQAGLAAGAAASAAGLSVTVLEKTARHGGSAFFSAGILWTAPDLETMREVVPGGDVELARALVEGFEPAVQRVRDAGIEVTERWEQHFGFGVAYRADIHAIHADWRSQIEDLRLQTPVRELIVEDGVVCGVALDDEELRADAVLLATGGFQGDRELVKAFLGWDADDALVRSALGSVGDGFRMARAAGAAASRGLGTFYGHTVPVPLSAWEPEHYLPLTQYHSTWSVLVNRDGRRYTDESLGDDVANQMTLRQPGGRGFLLCDERVRRDRVVGPPYPHGQVIDRFEEARRLGAHVASAPTLDALIDVVVGWGVDRGGVKRTLARELAPLREPPFWAVELQPTITFTLGGVAVDAWGRVLDRDGAAVRGLYCAGGDAGGLQGPRYVAGLVLGMVFGPRVVEAVMTDMAKESAHGT